MNVTVVIPVYNGEMWISRAIDSVLSQTIAPAEILVIDDGSTDGTARAVERYEPMVRCIRQQNGGASSARNRGIIEARSEWIAFLDSDDEWFPHWIATHQSVLRNHETCRWSFCSFEYARKGMRWAARRRGAPHIEGIAPYFEAMTRGMEIGTPGLLLHRSVFDRAGMFNTTLSRGEDLDLWTRIAMRFPLIAYSPEICWRCWLDNTSSLTRADYPRDEVLNSLCENMRISYSLGEDVAKAYYPYARRRVISYILRAAARTVSVNPRALHEAKTLFSPSYGERLLETMLKVLPTPIAGKIVSRLID